MRHAWRSTDLFEFHLDTDRLNPPTLNGSGCAHYLDLEAGFVFKVNGVVVGASCVGVTILVQRIPAVDRCYSQDAVNVGLGSSMKREVVNSWQPSVMRATRKGWRSRGHEVDVPASPGGPVVPLLVDGPSEFREPRGSFSCSGNP